MQRYKIWFLVLILFCILTFPAFGAFEVRSGISGYGGAAFCIPTADYLRSYPGDSSVKMPAFRTSGSFGLDFEIMQFKFGSQGNPFVVGAGLSYVTVSQSIAYGASVLRPYSGFGGFVQLGGVFSDFFSLNLLFRLAYCLFPYVKQAFIMYEFELIPTFKIASFGPSDLYVITPVTTSIKSDAVTIRLSCGVKLEVSFDKIINRGHKDE